MLLFRFYLNLIKYAEGFLEDNKSKFIPTEEDLNPNTKFINNRIFSILLKDEILIKKLSRVSVIWRKGDLDIIRESICTSY